MRISRLFAGRALTAAIVAALASVPAAAQQATTTATVRGIVRSPEGTPVVGATVAATNAETGVRRGAQTDEKGRYQIPFLAPGTYTLRAQRIGYRAVERANVQLAITQVEQEDFTLQSATVR